MLQSFTTYYGHMIAGFEFAALETAYFSSRPGKPANMVFVGVGPWVQSFSGLSSITPETSKQERKKRTYKQTEAVIRLLVVNHNVNQYKNDYIKF
jgi:hypothetical protein